MEFRGDVITMVNTVLCFTILILGCWSYGRRGDKISIFIGIAFALFGLSHVATLLGLRNILENFLIVVRMLAYLIVILAMLKTIWD